jgi:hypothetical protein
LVCEGTNEEMVSYALSRIEGYLRRK